MYLPQNDISEVVLRQRNKRDELSKALCKNKTKVAEVLKDLRILTQPFNTDFVAEMKDLDDEIEKLRRCCHEMANKLNEIENGNRENAEQRLPVRPAPPPPPQAPPRVRPYTLFAGLPPRSNRPSPSPQSPASQHSQHSQSPSPVCPVPSPEQSQPQLQPKEIDENDGNDPNCGEQPWECSMCTFRNHPLLNKCEFCDNVRILPGSVRIVPSNPTTRPLFGLCTQSEPPTPATPASGPPSARILNSLPSEFNRSAVPSSTSEGNLIQFANDVLI